MSVLLDTCIWSYPLRRRNDLPNQQIINALNNIIQQRQVVMLG